MAWRYHAALSILWLGTLSCGLLVGIEDLNGDNYGGASSAGNPGGGGPGGQGGAGSGGGPGACADQPDGTACYEGPPDTLGVGECHAGVCDGGSCTGSGEPYTENCLTTDIDENCDGNPECDGAGLWHAVIRGPGAQADILVATDPGQNVLVAGTFEDSIQIIDASRNTSAELVNTTGPSKPSDIFLAKLDHDGDLIWSKRFGDAEMQTVVSIDSYGSGSFAIGGNFTGVLDLGGLCQASASGAEQGYVAMFDADGNCSWMNAFAATVNAVAASEQTPPGLVFAGGSYAGVVSFDGNVVAPAATDNDAYVVTMRGDGTFVAVATSVGAGNEQVTHLESRSNVTWALGTFDSTTAALSRIALAELGGGADIFLGRVDGDSGYGSFDLAKYFGGPGQDVPRGVAVGPDGAVVANVDHIEAVPNFPEVQSTGGLDAFVVKFPNSGEGAEWAITTNGPLDQSLAAVDVDSDGQVVFVGRVQGETGVICDPSSQGEATDDGLVQKIYSGGACWVPPLRFTAVGSAQALDVAIDDLGYVIVAGSYAAAAVDLGDGAKLDASHEDGLADLFILKRAP